MKLARMGSRQKLLMNVNSNEARPPSKNGHGSNALASRRILLVEDSPTQAARFAQVLGEDGVEVVRAASAEIALKLLENERPDLIVLDNGLPSMTGNEFCREIRLNVSARAIPVLMLTAEDSNDAEREGLISGADDYVVKSVDPDILRARIHALLRKAEPKLTIPDVENHFDRARVLVIDDSVSYLELVRDFLKAEHYHVSIAADPEDGLRRFAESNFDCVLVDFQMPALEGPEVCRRIRESRRDGKADPILIMYSSYDDKGHMTESFEAGADDYISKSADVSVTKARIRALLRRRGLIEENRRISEEIRLRELEAIEERSRRQMLDREIEIAGEVQRRLFPRVLPDCPTLEYAGRCRPARGVGGDYYDFLALPRGHLGISIGDISGKGIPAALLMASLQASVRGQAFIADQSVAAMVSNVNRLLYQASIDGQYATFFYAQYDPATRNLVYTNGGHNPPLVLRGTKVIRLDEGGPPLGMFDDACYEQGRLQLMPGDLLVLYTDGISEAENSEGRDWGDSELRKTVRTLAGKAPAEVIERILSAADDFADGAPQHDDMTVVAAFVH